jgi:hypothetical protein
VLVGTLLICEPQELGEEWPFFLISGSRRQLREESGENDEHKKACVLATPGDPGSHASSVVNIIHCIFTHCTSSCNHEYQAPRYRWGN